ncbi:DgyrCDS7605 [Dimorphilus gyrociliatus]|uniref:DgyrCDS7605 n=1 Tax=Dimorphilus gyrociliatus TaxID=2664684 RepID=A0A7I8VRN6_9ANNE|nr:DgyrCDS7605 [Dimorphilus gyrociliatus]
MKVLAPNYKSRSEDFKKIFKNIPGDERLLVDYSCALQKDILVHGRLYITQNWICFYANIFRWETMLTIRCDNIKAITKEKTARVIPNAVQILTENEKYFFTSFASRDKAFLMLFRVWQNALMDQPMDSQELWQMVHHSYGEELGLTSSDDDYVAPPVDEDEQSSSLTVHYKSKALDDDGLDNVKISKEPSSSLITPNSSYSPLEDDGSPTIDQTMTALNDDPSDFEMFTENLCESHEHPGKLYLDEVFSIDVDQMFQLLFTDSEFYLEFIRARKTSDLKLTPWPDESDENGGKCRTITYTLSLNYHIGPKSTLSIEKQTMQSDTRPGNCYIIDTEVSNPSVPHGDSFYVFSRYCILKVSEKRSRLKVHSEVRYLKNAWGLVKTVHLRKEADRVQEFHNPSVTTIANSKKRQNRRRRKNSIDRIVKVLPDTNIQNERTFVEFTSFIRMDTYTLIRLLCILLGLLIFMNLYLYMKISQLESKANPVFSSRRYDFRPDQNVPEKWSNVINEQQSLHKNEMEYWKEILGSSILVIDQIKKTLEGLQATVDHKLQESTANN